jgi:hypothetical protein
LKNWFQNALRNPTRSETGSKKLLNLSASAGSGANPPRKRTEQVVNTYFRLFKEDLQPEIDIDYARQDVSICHIAHRNRFLAQKLKNAPEDVKQLVERSRLRAGDGEQRRIVWADADVVTAEEIERRDKALKLSE